MLGRLRAATAKASTAVGAAAAARRRAVVQRWQQNAAAAASVHTTAAHKAVAARTAGASTTPPANRSVVAVPAFALAIEEAGKRGDTQEMLRLSTAFNKARLKPNVGILNSVVGAFAAHNDRRNAFKYFYSMKELRLDPNADTFNALLAMWSRHGDVPNVLQWLRAMRRNQTLPTRATVRACREAFMVRGVDPNSQFTYLKDAKTLKRLLSITPDVVAQIKQTHNSNVLERRQRRAKWLAEALSGGKGDAKAAAAAAAAAAASAGSGPAASAAAAADDAAAAGGKVNAKAAAKVEKKNKAAAKDAAAAAEAAVKAALDSVKPDAKWDRVISAVEAVHPSNSASATGIPDATDSAQNLKRARYNKKHPRNPEPLADAAPRAFIEQTRPVALRF